jgi:hypothetical protein
MAFRRKKSESEADPGPPAPTPGSTPGQKAYAAFRVSVPTAPDLSGAVWFAAASPAEAARGGTADGLLDGWWVEFWDVPDPRMPFATIVLAPPGDAFDSAVVCERSGTGSDHLLILTPDGATSRQGPFASVPDVREFSERTFDMVLGMLARRALRSSGVPIADERQRAGDSPAFTAFAQHGRFPLIDSWVVTDRIDLGGIPCRRIELWDRTVDGGPDNPYHTPWVAAGFVGDRIEAMVAVETMPAQHDDMYLIRFEPGSRANVGVFPGTDLAAFRDVAFKMLTARLASS